jgi:hypothetical protein
MSLADDIAADSAIFDGGETVTLRQIRPAGVSEVTVSNALHGRLARRHETKAGVNLTGNERVWSLGGTQVGSKGVEVGDQIVESDSTIWSAIWAEYATLDSRWRCVTRKEE